MKQENWDTLPDGPLTERAICKFLEHRTDLLAPVHLEHVAYHNGTVDLAGSWDHRRWSFTGVVRARSTPQQLQVALDQAQALHQSHPLIVVPYLTDQALQRLEDTRISGIDLCGNGILIIPGELLVRRGGAPNRYPESAPIRNPFAGRAAVVTRRLILQMRWDTLNDLHAALEQDATPVSLSMCSKVISALVDENLVVKEQRHIRVRDRMGVLDGLARHWSRVRPRRRQAVRLGANTDPARLLTQRLGNSPWVISGASSVVMYAAIGQSGPLEVIVEDIDQAMRASQATPEEIPSFAQVVFVTYDEPGCLCGIQPDANGTHWSGPLQVWLELQAGDARQRAMATDLFPKIL